jgi:hypothetical protein
MQSLSCFWRTGGCGAKVNNGLLTAFAQTKPSVGKHRQQLAKQKSFGFFAR